MFPFHSAEKFDVTLPFLLQQAAWLYDHQLQRARAHIRSFSQLATNSTENMGVNREQHHEARPTANKSPVPMFYLPQAQSSSESILQTSSLLVSQNAEGKSNIQSH